MTVINRCTSSGIALYLYQVLILERYQSYREDTISIVNITEGNNSARHLVMIYICAKFREITTNYKEE